MGERVAELPLTVEVLPILLPKPAKEYSIYYPMRVKAHKEPEERFCLTPARYRRQIEDLKEHGFMSATIYGGDIDAAKKAIAIRREVGLIGDVMTFTGGGGDPEYYRQVMLANSDLSLGFLGVDEAGPRNARKMKRAIEFAEKVHAYGGKIGSATYAKHMERFKTLLDLSIVSFNAPGSYFTLEYMKRSMAGKISDKRKRWYYWTVKNEAPRRHRLLAGFYLWKSRFNGICPFGYQHLQGDNPYDDFGRSYKVLTVTYPSQQGPIPTLSWEALREGIDDVRYLTALTDSIAKCGDKKRAREANAVIERTMNRIDPLVPRAEDRLRTKDFMTFRREIADQVIRLTMADQ